MLDYELVSLYNRAHEVGKIKERLLLRDEILKQLRKDTIDDIFNEVLV